MALQVTETDLPGVMILEPSVFDDHRGFFFESFNNREFQLATGQFQPFVQDNHSKSVTGVLRGLHYQLKKPQGKLVRAIQGTIYDVAVDIRKGSPAFGEWVGCELSEENKRQLWVPPNFAHGFMVLSDSAQVIYKVTEYYESEDERSILWNDPEIGICWPNNVSPLVSVKDLNASLLSNAELPQYLV